LAKTNREQSLIVHALFGKRNLRNLRDGQKPTPDCYRSSMQKASEATWADRDGELDFAPGVALSASRRVGAVIRITA
jgi:hypothetical protein